MADVKTTCDEVVDGGRCGRVAVKAFANLGQLYGLDARGFATREEGWGWTFLGACGDHWTNFRGCPATLEELQRDRARAVAGRKVPSWPTEALARAARRPVVRGEQVTEATSAAGKGRFVTEASDLAWPPGQWPPELALELRATEALVLRRARPLRVGDELYGYVYETRDGSLTLEVLND